MGAKLAVKKSSHWVSYIPLWVVGAKLAVKKSSHWVSYIPLWVVGAKLAVKKSRISQEAPYSGNLSVFR